MNEIVPLTQDNLSRLPEAVAIPRYDRASVRTGIVHVGVGGFHRSHEAYYTDALMNTGNSLNWGICGVGLREADRKIASVLKAQDYLYTLIVRHPNGSVENRVIGALVDFMIGPDDPQAVIDKMASPDTHIVSLTITEGGYNVDSGSGEFDFSNPDAQHDLQNPSQPRLVFGYLTEALRKRRDNGIRPFTIQSCDNIQHNGNLTRRMVLEYARRQDSELAKWIENEVRFPNAMVDRITPVTTSIDLQYLEQEMGIRDQWPVTCEPFCQWIIEDQFSGDRPAWENVGTQFVPDVTPYEKMKIRLLNAGHSVVGILGAIYGYETIDQCIADDLFATYLRNFMEQEVTPVLDEVPGIDLVEYQNTLIERLGNPNMKDNVSRICLESSSKLPVFLIPTIRENLARGGAIQYSALVIAAWCLYSDKRVNRHGKPLEIIDGKSETLHREAARTQDDVLAFLKINSIFDDLAENEKFAQVYSQMIRQIYEDPDVSVPMKGLLQC